MLSVVPLLNAQRASSKATSVIPSSSSSRRVSGEAFPQCLKLPVRAYDLSQALAIEIRFQALADVSENERDSVLRQILDQLFESASRCIEPRNDRRSRDLCVTHRLWNVHSSQRYARGQIAASPERVKRKEALKERQAPASACFLFRGLGGAHGCLM